jgi:hypothetical protein
MKLLILTVALASCVACGGSPGSPTPVPPPIVIPSITLTGHVTATNGGQPLAGLAVDLGGQIATTDGAGGFAVQMAPGASGRLLLTGAGIVPRSLLVAVNATRDVAVDAIGVAGFDLNFYRQLVRNTFDAPAGMEPLRRWTAAPTVYLRTVRDDGTPIASAMLDTVAATIQASVPLWTAGRFNVGGIERGTETRQGQAGWLTVTWPGEVGADRVCGRSNVGLSGGTIDLYVPTAAACGCNGTTGIRPRMVRHELGHAMGFWHTDTPSDVMTATSGVCDALPSARERAAAAIAYARPVGNTDPDVDPAGAVTLAPMRVR